MSGSMAVRGALVARLLAVAPGAALAVSSVEWRNRKYPRTPGVRYYRATFLPGIPEPAAASQYAPDRHTGLFQVDVFEPADTGEETAIAEAERIAACYARGTALSYGGVTVQVTKSYRSTGDSSDPAWFMVSAVIAWRADVEI